MAKHHASLIRLDAFAYAVKKLDTSDFFVEPEIWDLLAEVRQDLAGTDAQILPEIHEHYTLPKKVSDHGYFIYDFALPMVLLCSLYTGKSQRLAAWLKQCPMKQFTTLDTHDGLGVVDAKDILTDEEIDYTIQELYKVGANVKRKYSSAEYNNLDIYQINTTYYSALGNDDRKYFLARLLQIFAPGIPQIDYVGLLAGENDLDLLESSKEGRNINCHYYSLEEIAHEVDRPVVAKFLKLLELRNSEAAFDLAGLLEVATPSEHEIVLTRVNLADLTYQITVNGQAVDL